MSDVVIETDRLIIRDVTMPDGEAFIHMASDGSLNDVGFDKDCSSWMHDWIIEAQNLEREDNPRKLDGEYKETDIRIRHNEAVKASASDFE